MQEIVECELIVNSNISGQSDNVVIDGKGYYKEEDDLITVYFSNGKDKYKYVYDGDILIVSCGDSCYRFKNNRNESGEIKNGDYIFKITTYTTKLEIKNRVIVLDYTLSQNNQIIGFYKSKLSF